LAVLVVAHPDFEPAAIAVEGTRAEVELDGEDAIGDGDFLLRLGAEHVAIGAAS
jgi:hypothetical protein